MALIKNKKEFIGAVATIVGADMGIQDLVFPKARPRRTKLIEYDYATIEGASASYHSFAETAQVVEKDGKSTITLAPINFNESISKDEIDANASKFGENEYGDGSIDAVTESALNGVGKLALRAMIGTKRAMYEALTTHKITGGYKGANGVEDIVFNTPTANKQVLTNTGSEVYWNTIATAKPVDNLYSAYEAMIIKPSFVIMNSTDYGYFYDNAQVLTADNSSTGTKKNYTLNENRDPEADFFKAGTLQHKDMMLDVYVERGTYKDAVGSDVKFLLNSFVILGSRGQASTEFGGIPVAKNGGVTNISAEIDVEELITSNPPVHELVHRTAPLPLLKNGNAFYSMKVTA